MIAVLYKESGKRFSSGGIAFGTSMSEIFDVIDEFTDPRDVLIKYIEKGGINFNLTEYEEEDYELEGTSFSYGIAGDLFEKGWRKPKWPKKSVRGLELLDQYNENLLRINKEEAANG